MEAAAPVGDVSCGVFGKLARLAELDPNAINRFVVGEDTQPRAMSDDEAAAELGDPFATLVLLKGNFPRTAGEALEALAEAAGPNDQLSKHRSFVLGEGSQLTESPAADAIERDVRFVVSTGTDGKGPDVIVSAFHPESPDIELMAWDRVSQGFNFYRAVGDPPAWVFAGNSAHSLTDPTRGKGPFESHASGSLLMKELKIPWNNWHSFEEGISEDVFPEGDMRRSHPWFTEKQGAEVCETAVAVPSMVRWAEARFDRIDAAGGQVSDTRRLLEQVLGTPTVNLISSRATSQNPDAKGGVKVPPTFFLDSDALTSEKIELSGPPEFGVETATYRASLEKFDFALREPEADFEQKGDTKFAFLVPERAKEDVVIVEEGVRRGLFTPRLAATLLMVDFPNPIFSPRRQALLVHVPASATIANGASAFSEEMANATLAAADAAGPQSPEQEFAALWKEGEGGEDAFKAPFNAKLEAYYAAITAKLATQDGFDDYVRLAESRRRRAKKATPILREFALLFPTTNIEDGERQMRPDGSVADAAA